MRERVTVVTLSVCLSTSDFEDGGAFMFETGINVELCNNLSSLNVAFFKNGPSRRKKRGNFAHSNSTTRDTAPYSSRAEAVMKLT